MKHHTLHILLTVIAFFSLLSVSCTHNNGDIGDWFGTWRLESITIDGATDPDYTSPRLIWKFQSQVVMIMEPNDDMHEANYALGSWHQEGNDLLLDFDYDLGNYAWMLHFPVKATLKILKLSGSAIELQYTDDVTNKVYHYKLKRWG